MDANHPWYVKGAEMASRVFHQQAIPYGYFCPLCTALFEPANAALLSREHVPAKSMGGLAMCLTCRACNSAAGTILDSAVRRREDNFDFAAGTMKDGDRIAARVTVGGVTANAQVQSTGGSGAAIVIMVPPEHNPPGMDDLLTTEMRVLGPSATINVSFVGSRYKRAQASAGMLRYGYLTAFAQLGYFYASGAALDGVRKKIREPDREPHVFGIFQYAAAPDTRRFWLINDPPESRSIAVQIGREIVFLPRERNDVGFYERFAARKEGPVFSADVTATELTWPDEPRYIEDDALF